MKTLVEFINEALTEKKVKAIIVWDKDTKQENFFLNPDRTKIKRLSKGDKLYGVQFDLKNKNNTSGIPVEYKVKDIKTEVDKSNPSYILVTKTVYVEDNEMKVDAFIQSVKLKISSDDHKDFWDKIKECQEFIKTDGYLLGIRGYKANDWEYYIDGMLLKGKSQPIEALPKSKKSWGGPDLYRNEDDLKNWLFDDIGGREYFNIVNDDPDKWTTFNDVTTEELANKFIEKYKSKFDREKVGEPDDVLQCLGVYDDGWDSTYHWWNAPTANRFIDMYFKKSHKKCKDLFDNTSDKITFHYGNFDGVLDMKGDWFARAAYFEYKDRTYLLLGLVSSALEKLVGDKYDK